MCCSLASISLESDHDRSCHLNPPTPLIFAEQLRFCNFHRTQLDNSKACSTRTRSYGFSDSTLLQRHPCPGRVQGQRFPDHPKPAHSFPFEKIFKTLLLVSSGWPQWFLFASAGPARIITLRQRPIRFFLQCLPPRGIDMIKRTSSSLSSTAYSTSNAPFRPLPVCYARATTLSQVLRLPAASERCALCPPSHYTRIAGRIYAWCTTILSLISLFPPR